MTTSTGTRGRPPADPAWDAVVARLAATTDYEKQSKRGYSKSVFDLTRVVDCLDALDLKLRPAPLTFHVAGSKGKGSTVRFLEALAIAQGMRTVSAISPHLVDMRERIRVDGRPMTPAQGAAFLTPALDWAAQTNTALTYFDLMTIAAFQAAKDTSAECCVLEVGLGGRLDSTNVVDPTACAITLLELEHTEFLGDTVEKIAAEKGGIIKPGRPCVVAPFQQPSTEGVLRRIADGISAPLWWFGKEWNAIPTAGLQLLVERTVPRGMDRGPITRGPHSHNAAETTAIAAWRAGTGEWPTDEIVHAANRIVRYPACVELVLRDGQPPLVVDAAHTPSSAAHLAVHANGPWREVAVKRGTERGTLGIVFGCMTDKDAAGILHALRRASDGFARTLFVPRPPQSPRALPAAALAEAAQHAFEGVPGFELVMLPNRDEPFTPAAAEKLAPGAWWIVTGSLYLAGEIRNLWLGDEGL